MRSCVCTIRRSMSRLGSVVERKVCVSLDDSRKSGLVDRLATFRRGPNGRYDWPPYLCQPYCQP